MAQSWTGGSLSLLVFDASLDDEIDGFAFDAKLGGFTGRNVVGQSQRRGAELTLEALWLGARWCGAYVYVDSESGDVREPRRPRHLANLSVRRPLSARVSIGAGLIQYGNSFDQDFSTYPATPVELDAFRLLRADLEIRPTTVGRSNCLSKTRWMRTTRRFTAIAVPVCPQWFGRSLSFDGRTGRLIAADAREQGAALVLGGSVGRWRAPRGCPPLTQAFPSDGQRSGPVAGLLQRCNKQA